MKNWSVTALVALASLHVGCNHAAPSPRNPPPRVARTEAEALFWDVFNHQQHARIPEVLSALQLATRTDPENPRPYLLLGATQVWRLAEPALSHLDNPAQAAEAAIGALSHYHHLAPGDGRVFTWMAPAWVGQGQGMAGAAEHMPMGPDRDAMLKQATALLESGFDAIDEGVSVEPRFNLFGRFIITALYPVDSERFRQAVADVARLHDLRLGAHVDPRHPDVTPFLESDSPCDPEHPKPWPYPANTAETTFRTDPKCWNTWKTPFAFQGFWLFSGDVAMKNGDVAAARTMYENAKKLSNYTHWPYAFYLEDRLKNVEEYARRFQDKDPANDPELVFRAPFECVMCHTNPDLKPTLPPDPAAKSL